MFFLRVLGFEDGSWSLLKAGGVYWDLLKCSVEVWLNMLMSVGVS